MIFDTFQSKKLKSVKGISVNGVKNGENNLGGILESQKNFAPSAVPGGDLPYTLYPFNADPVCISPHCSGVFLHSFYIPRCGLLAFQLFAKHPFME